MKTMATAPKPVRAERSPWPSLRAIVSTFDLPVIFKVIELNDTSAKSEVDGYLLEFKSLYQISLFVTCFYFSL